MKYKLYTLVLLTLLVIALYACSKQGSAKIDEIVETVEKGEIQATMRAGGNKWKIWCSGTGCNNSNCQVKMNIQENYVECSCTETQCTLNAEKNGITVSSEPDSLVSYFEGRNLFFEDLDTYAVDSLSDTISSILKLEFETPESGNKYSIYFEFLVGTSSTEHHVMFLGSGTGTSGPTKAYKCSGTCPGAAECKARLDLDTNPPTPFCSCETTCTLNQ